MQDSPIESDDSRSVSGDCISFYMSGESMEAKISPSNSGDEGEAVNAESNDDLLLPTLEDQGIEKLPSIFRKEQVVEVPPPNDSAIEHIKAPSQSLRVPKDAEESENPPSGKYLCGQKVATGASLKSMPTVFDHDLPSIFDVSHGVQVKDTHGHTPDTSTEPEEHGEALSTPAVNVVTISTNIDEPLLIKAHGAHDLSKLSTHPVASDSNIEKLAAEVTEMEKLGVMKSSFASSVTFGNVAGNEPPSGAFPSSDTVELTQAITNEPLNSLMYDDAAKESGSSLYFTRETRGRSISLPPDDVAGYEYLKKKIDRRKIRWARKRAARLQASTADGPSSGMRTPRGSESSSKRASRSQQAVKGNRKRKD